MNDKIPLLSKLIIGKTTARITFKRDRCTVDRINHRQGDSRGLER